MTREEKILFLRRVESGQINPRGPVSDSAVVIYSGESFRISGTTKIMNHGELQNHIEKMKTVIFLPDNGR